MDKWWGFTQDTMPTHFDAVRHVRFVQSGFEEIWDCLECKEMAEPFILVPSLITPEDRARDAYLTE